jgi:hypothetical protein
VTSIEALPTILKYTGSIVAGFYGLYATLTDFKEEKNGKKVLSSKGRRGIVLLACATILSISADAAKDYNEVGERKRERDRRDASDILQQNMQTKLGNELDQTKTINSNLSSTSAKIDRNLIATSHVLSEVERAADPIPQNLRVRAIFTVAGDQPLVRPYMERIRSIVSEKIKVSRSNVYEIWPSDDLYPQPFDYGERPMRNFADRLELDVRFTKLGSRLTVAQQEESPDLRLHFHCGGWTYPAKADEQMVPTQNLDIKYFAPTSVEADYLRVECLAKAEFYNNKGPILSLRDFSGASVKMMVFRDPAEEHFGEQKDKFLVRFTLVLVSLQTDSSRFIYLGKFKKERCLVYDRMDCYSSKVDQEP